MFDMCGYGSGARFLLETAVKKRDMRLAEWLLAHGAHPNAAPARDRRFPKRSLYECAVLEDLPDMAELFVRYGASRTAPPLDEHERFVDACFGLDRDAARRSVLAHPEYLQSPAAMFDAARRDRSDVMALLVELGVSLEIHDRTGKRALHEAAASGALGSARWLVERGAEIDPREAIYNGTPLGWAAHGDKSEMVSYLSRYSRDIWSLCFNGYVDRLREVLTEDPGAATVVSKDGQTPLWWLPDDETKAMQTVELLLAAGANPAAKSTDGDTAADWARRRGMGDVAVRLEAQGRSEDVRM
jgi:ankyrin repeat protein